VGQKVYPALPALTHFTGKIGLGPTEWGSPPSVMRCEFPNILGEDEIRTLAIKWWGNGILPPHYFEALREAARLGAERALQSVETEEVGTI
jgi:hypothetical protein